MATKMKKNTPPVLALLDEPVVEAPKAHPPARFAASVNALKQIIDSPDSGSYRRLTEPTVHRESATRLASNLRSAAKWMRENQMIREFIDVGVHKHDTGISTTARTTPDTFAVYARVEDSSASSSAHAHDASASASY